MIKQIEEIEEEDVQEDRRGEEAEEMRRREEKRKECGRFVKEEKNEKKVGEKWKRQLANCSTEA